MELYRVAYLFLFALTLQVGALPSESEERDAAQKHHIILADANKSIATLKGLYTEAKTTLDRLQSCGPLTHLEMLRLAAVKLSDFQGCVNATREIADYEEFLFHFYYYVKFVGYTVKDIAVDVFECRHQSGVFNILNCTVSEIQTSGPEFDEILSKAKDLIGEVEADTYNLILYIKRCLGYSASEFFSEMQSLVQNNC